MWRELWRERKRRLRAAKIWAKVTFCQRTFIVRFVLLGLSGGIVALHAMAKPPPDSNLFGKMMSTVVTPGAAGTAFLILLTILVARVFTRPCAHLLAVLWDAVVLVLWTVLLTARVVWLVLQWKAAEESANASAKNLYGKRDISARDIAEMSFEILEEGLLMLLLVGAVVGHSAQAWITVGEMLSARRQFHLQALERQRARQRLERRVALRRLRELYEPAPHVHLSQLPAAPRTLVRLSEGRLLGYASRSASDSLWVPNLGVRDSASYMSALSQLQGSEERLVQEVEFQEHVAPESTRWLNPLLERLSSTQLTYGRPRSGIAPPQTSRADDFEHSLQDTPLPQDDSKVRFQQSPQHALLPQDDPKVPTEQSSHDTLLPQDDQEQQSRPPFIPHILIEHNREDLPQLSLAEKSSSQLPRLVISPLEEPPHQPSEKRRTACGKCVHPAESETFMPTMSRSSRNATNVSKELSPPTVTVPRNQDPPGNPCSASTQTSQSEGELFVYEQPVGGVCLCTKIMDAPENREPGTENRNFSALAVHEQSSQDQHLQQQVDNTGISGSLLSSWKSPTSMERPTVKVAVAPGILEANDNVQDQFLDNSQAPNQNTDSHDQEMNVTSKDPSSNGNPTASCVCQAVLDKRLRQ